MNKSAEALRVEARQAAHKACRCNDETIDAPCRIGGCICWSPTKTNQACEWSGHIAINALVAQCEDAIQTGREFYASLEVAVEERERLRAILTKQTKEHDLAIAARAVEVAESLHTVNCRCCPSSAPYHVRMIGTAYCGGPCRLGYHEDVRVDPDCSEARARLLGEMERVRE